MKLSRDLQNEITTVGDCTIIKMPTGESAIIDTECLPLVENYYWTTNKSTKSPSTYINGEQIYMRRILAGVDKNQKVRCGDRNGYNLRKSNLKICTINTSDIPGVCYSVGERGWRAQTRIDGKRVWLGLFNTEQEAADAINAFLENSDDTKTCTTQKMQTATLEMWNTDPIPATIEDIETPTYTRETAADANDTHTLRLIETALGLEHDTGLTQAIAILSAIERLKRRVA